MSIPKPHRDPPYRPAVWRQPGPVLILSDLHVPYHDRSAIETALDETSQFCRLSKTPLSLILLNGDNVDCHEISRFQRLPGKPSYVEEMGSLRELLLDLRRRFKKTPIWFKLGNHEWRLEKYLIHNAPALATLPELSLAGQIAASDLKIDVIPQDVTMRFGDMAGLHGHEFGESRSSPLNPAKTLFDRALCSAFCGHHHQTSSFTKRDLLGNLHRTYTMGCLSTLTPEYRRINQYNHGFAILHLLDKTRFEFHNFRIESGRVTQ